METIRVVVAEDNLQLRDMIAQYLAQQDGIEVTGTAANAPKPCSSSGSRSRTCSSVT